MADFTAATITTPGAAQARELRRHQGIPGVEILPGGTIFVCFYLWRLRLVKLVTQQVNILRQIAHHLSECRR